MLIKDLILPEFDEEIASTRKLIAAIPDAILDYKPHEKSMTLRRLASHVVDMTGGWPRMTMTTEVLNFDETKWEPYVAESVSHLLADLDKGSAEARPFLDTTDEEYEKTWTMIWGGQTIMSLPRYKVMQGMVLNHIVHHRAQLTVYLRLNNVPVPGLYGPSADEMPAASA